MTFRHCEENPVLGFDCEWVLERKVALLQLCTHKGYCALIRLCKMTTLPQSLCDLLQDRNVVKVGVEALSDAVLLRNSNLPTVSTLDLRFVAVLTGAKPKKLAAMYNEVVGGTLDKDWEKSKSNWEANNLTQSQIDYAAGDAIAGLKIYMALYRRVPDVKVFKQYYDKEYVRHHHDGLQPI